MVGYKGAFRAHQEHVLLELRAHQKHVLLELRAQQTAHFESKVVILAIFIRITVNRQKDPEQDTAPCNKDYPEDSGITGGFCHISCNHRKMKDATALRKGESPGGFVRVLVKRLPKRVKASKRVFIYDIACNAHKWALRRYPH